VIFFNIFDIFENIETFSSSDLQSSFWVPDGIKELWVVVHRVVAEWCAQNVVGRRPDPTTRSWKKEHGRFKASLLVTDHYFVQCVNLKVVSSGLHLKCHNGTCSTHTTEPSIVNQCIGVECRLHGGDGSHDQKLFGAMPQVPHRNFHHHYHHLFAQSTDLLLCQIFETKNYECNKDRREWGQRRGVGERGRLVGTGVEDGGKKGEEARSRAGRGGKRTGRVRMGKEWELKSHSTFISRSRRLKLEGTQRSYL